jgi:hypothetical protein
MNGQGADLRIDLRKAARRTRCVPQRKQPTNALIAALVGHGQSIGARPRFRSMAAKWCFRISSFFEQLDREFDRRRDSRASSRDAAERRQAVPDRPDVLGFQPLLGRHRLRFNLVGVSPSWRRHHRTLPCASRGSLVRRAVERSSGHRAHRSWSAFRSPTAGARGSPTSIAIGPGSGDVGARRPTVPVTQPPVGSQPIRNSDGPRAEGFQPTDQFSVPRPLLGIRCTPARSQVPFLHPLLADGGHDVYLLRTLRSGHAGIPKFGQDVRIRVRSRAGW